MKPALGLLLGLLLAAAPSRAEMRADIEYAKADGVSLTLDAWVPDGAGPFATVIVVHGGAWKGGDKQTFVKPLFEPLTKAGFAWFTINYRLAPAHRYPAAVEDVENAVRYVKAHAREYKVDLKRLAITGESAGGHLVSLVGAKDGRQLGIAAVVPFYGAHDLESLALGEDKTPVGETALRTFIGFTAPGANARRLLRQASPITYVTKDMPPYLLIHGNADITVPYNQSVKMRAKMQEAGAACELFTVDGAPHGIGPWEKNPAWQAYKVKMIQWLQATLH